MVETRISVFALELHFGSGVCYTSTLSDVSESGA